jgi:hypothetical protein
MTVVIIRRLNGAKSMVSFLWWAKMVFIGFISFFFLLFGIDNLIGSFHIKNPFEFIMYFFSASFMILVSIVGIIYPALKVCTYNKKKRVGADEK